MRTAWAAACILAVALMAWRYRGSLDTSKVVPQPTAISSPAVSSPEPSQLVHSLSLKSWAAQDFNGRDFTVGRVLEQHAAYTRYFISHTSGELTISGIMNVPKGSGPFPLLILNHGYIDPAIYTNGRGLRREQDYLARQGYVVIHPDYRNHAQSDRDPSVELSFRLGYAEDVINLIEAVRAARLPYINVTRVGMLGHSMGGGVTQTVMVTKPELVDAVVLFAPVSADARDNFQRWTKTRPQVAAEIVAKYGAPSDTADFWAGISVRSFLQNVTAPVLIHHGTADASVPLAWSEQLFAALKERDKEVTLHVYPNEPHEFAGAWPQVMARTTDLFDQYVKNQP